MESTRNHSLVIYNDDLGNYIILNSGEKKYFKTLYEAMEGLVEEYPLEDGDELQ